MTDEEKQKLEDEKKEATLPKEVKMVITRDENGVFNVQFPLLPDKFFTYGFLKIAEKVLDKFYENAEKQLKTPPKGGIMNFVRGH